MTVRPLHVVEHWAPVTDGYAARSVALVGALAAREDCAPKVVVSSRQRVHGARGVVVPDGLADAVVAVPESPRERRRRRLRRWSVDRAALRDAVVAAGREHRADLVHVHWGSALGAAAAEAAGVLGVPLVAEVRFDLAGAMAAQSSVPVPSAAERWARRRFERHVAGADAVVTASWSLGELVRTSLAPSGPLTVVPNAVDACRFANGRPDPALRRASGARPGELLVGAVTNLLRYEGLDLLVDAVAAARAVGAPVRGLVVGDGPEARALRARAAARGGCVAFPGPVPPERAPDALATLDVVALPRRELTVTRHAAPIKALEAMAAGRPVVASAVGDLGALLATGRGVLVAPGSVDDLAAALVRLAADTDARRRLGAAGASHASAQTWAERAATLVEVYGSVGSR